MKTYKGTRTFKIHSHDASLSSGLRGFTNVSVNDMPLKSINGAMIGHNDDFEWACKNSCATNLSESILADFLEIEDVPKELIIPFRNDIISKLSFERWQLEEWEIEEYIISTLDLLKNGETDEFETVEELT